MCLGVPGRVVSIDPDDRGLRTGWVAFGGLRKSVCLAFEPNVKVGDFVLVHAGFAISRIDEAEAERTLRLLDDLQSMEEIR